MQSLGAKTMKTIIILVQEDTLKKRWFIAYQGTDVELANKTIREYRGWTIKQVIF
jgi:hypothetical protein